MIEEPKIRLAVSKHQLAADLTCLAAVLEEYGQFLATLDPPSDWPPQAQVLLKRHWDRLDRAKVSLQSLDLVGAVIRHVLALPPGQRIVVNLLEAEPAPPAPLAPLPRATSPESFRALVADIVGLTRNAPLAMQEKIRFLLGSLLRLVNQIPAGDEARLEEILSEINLLTSNRESQSLVREIALLAREVYDSIQALSDGLPLEALSETTDGASEAVRKLNGVMQRLEQTATENLDRVETLIGKLEGDQRTLAGLTGALHNAQQRLAELRVSHPQHGAALERAQTRLSDGVGAAAMQLRMRIGTTSERYLALMSGQGFQDHTGATLKRIVQFVERMQGQIVTLLEKYKSVLEMSLGPPDLAETPKTGEEEGERQSQGDVDKLLANLGF